MSTICGWCSSDDTNDIKGSQVAASATIVHTACMHAYTYVHVHKFLVKLFNFNQNATHSTIRAKYWQCCLDYNLTTIVLVHMIHVIVYGQLMQQWPSYTRWQRLYSGTKKQKRFSVTHSTSRNTLSNKQNNYWFSHTLNTNADSRDLTPTNSGTGIVTYSVDSDGGIGWCEAIIHTASPLYCCSWHCWCTV